MITHPEPISTISLMTAPGSILALYFERSAKGIAEFFFYPFQSYISQYNLYFLHTIFFELFLITKQNAKFVITKKNLSLKNL